VRIISAKTVRQWIKQFPDAAGSLKAWLRTSQKAAWESIEDVREIYPHADPVKFESGNTVTVFNIGGNRYRLITAIHYNRKLIFTLCFMTHAEYSKDRWKDKL
jgi:mRNA interferase HigB